MDFTEPSAADKIRIERDIRREAGLPEDPNWYPKLTYAHVPKPWPNTPWPCPRWIDPRWCARMWPRRLAGMQDDRWCDRLCALFNAIDRRGPYG